MLKKNKPNQCYHHIIKAFIGPSTLLLYTAGLVWPRRQQEEMDAPSQEERLRT